MDANFLHILYRPASITQPAQMEGWGEGEISVSRWEGFESHSARGLSPRSARGHYGNPSTTKYKCTCLGRGGVVGTAVELPLAYILLGYWGPRPGCAPECSFLLRYTLGGVVGDGHAPGRDERSPFLSSSMGEEERGKVVAHRAQHGKP